MAQKSLECSVPRRPQGSQRRKPYTLTFEPDALLKIQTVADAYGISLSRFLERAGLWYVKEVEADPTKLKPPEP